LHQEDEQYNIPNDVIEEMLQEVIERYDLQWHLGDTKRKRAGSNDILNNQTPKKAKSGI
jgi:hypothetical protein